MSSAGADEETYTRFSAAHFRAEPAAVASPPATAEVPVPDLPAPEPMRFESWEALLDWCLGIYAAQSAFVVEPEGFVIAHRGSWSLGHLEGVGPQLLTLTQSAREIEEGGRVRFVSFEFESFWLTGVITKREGMGDFIVAFLGEQRMTGQARELIHDQVLHNLDHL